MTTSNFISALNENAPPALRKLNGRVVGFDTDSQTIDMRYEIDASFCHSGNVVQGGYITGMLDAAMAHAVFCALERCLVVATLEINVSFLDIATPGELVAHARPLRLGKSIGFLEAELCDTEGTLLAKATSTARIIDKTPRP